MCEKLKKKHDASSRQRTKYIPLLEFNVVRPSGHNHLEGLAVVHFAQMLCVARERALVSQKKTGRCQNAVCTTHCFYLAIHDHLDVG
jgi:hypothetical protein